MSVSDVSLKTTERGFQLIDFKDGYGESCSIQASSIIGDYPDAFTRPGSSAIWIGHDSKRMHVDREGVELLVNILNSWLKTGKLYEGCQITRTNSPTDAIAATDGRGENQ